MFRLLRSGLRQVVVSICARKSVTNKGYRMITRQLPGGLTTRRTVVKGAAWSVPVVAVAGTAPALAASVRKDPGINGWVLNTHWRDSEWGCDRHMLDVTSLASGATPDGAPWGLYVYDVEPDDVITNAYLTYWVQGEHSSRRGDSTYISWSTQNGHSSCWQGPVRVGTEQKPDGRTYTGYRWTYACPIDASQAREEADGHVRLYLGNFHVRTDWFKNAGSNCDDLSYWAQRHITINDEVHTFQRRNGSLGPYGSGQRMAPQGVDPETLDAQVAELDAQIADLDAAIAAAGAAGAAAPAPATDEGTVEATDDDVVTAQPEDTVAAQPPEAPADTSDLQAERAQLLDQKASLEAQLAESEGGLPALPPLAC